jgi:uncharacterized membrane protein
MRIWCPLYGFAVGWISIIFNLNVLRSKEHLLSLILAQLLFGEFLVLHTVMQLSISNLPSGIYKIKNRKHYFNLH